VDLEFGPAEIVTEKMGKSENETEKNANLGDDVDALFKLPLSEFTGARNELATKLKKAGRADDANIVRTLAKPPVSAWAVNQLYWNHREEFDRLLETGQRFREASATARIADIRVWLDARSEALTRLSDLAAEVLRDGGHNPSPDTIHRITTTLEALSSTASEATTPGRLTQDVDPPTFASFASLIPSGFTAPSKSEPAKISSSQTPSSAPAKSGKSAADQQKIQTEETRRGKIAAAKASLQEAKKSLAEARAQTQQLETVQKKAQAEAKAADAEAKQAERQLRQAEDRFKKTSAVAQDAQDRAARSVAETREASRAVEEAKQAIEKSTKELELLLKQA